MNNSALPPAVFLMGPTASGKTDLAVQLAKEINAEIISVDSALVYKDMDIGTAKPTLEERQGIPHHLIDILDPSESYSTGHFRKSALKLMDEITKRGKVPILTGGTMLYFNSIFNGLAELPEANSQIRKALEKELLEKGKVFMHERLKSIDPDAAKRIHPNDPQRIQRALEVYEISGKPITHYYNEAQQKTVSFKMVKMIVSPEDRKQLHAKIAQRFRLMVEQGLIDEVNTLYSRGDLTIDLPAIRAVGYRQTWSYLQGEYGLDRMIEKGIIATRQLAKRQITWLRRETDAINFVSYEAGLTEKVFQRLKLEL